MLRDRKYLVTVITMMIAGSKTINIDKPPAG